MSKPSFSKLSLIILALSLALSAPLASAQVAPSYSITITNTSVTDLTLDISGTATGTIFEGLLSEYDVSVDWGDGDTTATSTTDFVDDGSGNFSGPWSNSHTYSEGGDYTVTVTLFSDDGGGPVTRATDKTSVNIPGSATLIVIKTVINDNDGTSVASDFTMNISGTNVSSTGFAGSESGVTVTINPGDYSVDEDAFAGYTKSLSSDCSGSIASDETKTCTITNDDDIVPGTATLIVTKLVINDDGRSSISTDFTINVTGDNVSLPSFSDDGESGTTVTLDPGSYSVDEDDAPGYLKDLSADCSGTIADGERKTCTITNNDTPIGSGVLIITKTVINDNEGTSSASDFTMSVAGGNVSSPSFPGSETGTTVTLDAGDYSVDENFVTGYTKSLGADCVGTIAVDETKYCTITNDDDVPVVIVEEPEIITPPTSSGGSSSSGGGSPLPKRPVLDDTPVDDVPDTDIPGDTPPGDTPGDTTSGGGSPTPTPTPSDPGGDIGEVLGATECRPYLLEYIKFGAENNPVEVLKLQVFLNENMGTTLELSGFYDQASYDAVHRFQQKYKEEVLDPWNIGSTGLVYLTTKRWINMLKCPELNIAMPSPLIVYSQYLIKKYLVS